MRHLLIATVVLGVFGCETRPLDPDEWAACEEDGPAFNTRIDPNHCGGCYVACEADVPCDDWLCQYNTPLHCGAPHRQCVAPAGKGVECVEHYVGGGATEAVNGFSCVVVDLPWSFPEEEPEPDPVDPRPPVTVAPPGWVGIPGTSDQCMDDVDGRLCQQATVEFIDLCGSDAVQPLPYDFEVMTTEVSRAQYRAEFCGECTDQRSALCRDVCGDLRAEDQAEREARPMTGLSWCEAYDTCRALGGRLPTVQERARLEALAFGSRALFRQETNCNAWTRETGSAPWLAECFDEPPEMLGFDRVDGESGVVLLGVDVLVEPQAVHHLLGNVEEWLADPAEVLTTGALLDGPRWWPTSATDDELSRPRVARGRSLFSPAGQSGSRLLVLEPSVRADDLGVRCARTTRSPYPQPTPYDFGEPAWNHAICEPERSGLRPVREMNGQQVFRATDICFEGRTVEARDFWESRLAQGLSSLALLTHVAGEVVALGPARFAEDEQWWLFEPASAFGDAMTIDDFGQPMEFTWTEVSSSVGDVCRRDMVATSQAATDGRLLRVVEFMLDAEDITWLNPAARSGPAAFACAHLDCFDPLDPTESCTDRCTRWRLPLAISFERVEPFDRAGMCAPSVWNPAER